MTDGGKIYIGHSKDNEETTKLVVYTAAVKSDNEELIRAKELNIPIIEGQFLGYIMKQYMKDKVAGTHGKTTTTL